MRHLLTALISETASLIKEGSAKIHLVAALATSRSGHQVMFGNIFYKALVNIDSLNTSALILGEVTKIFDYLFCVPLNINLKVFRWSEFP